MKDHPQDWPTIRRHPEASAWLQLQADLGLAPRTLEAYARGLEQFLAFCAESGTLPVAAGREDIARYVRRLTHQPSSGRSTSVVRGEPVGLANATIQQRLVAIRLFYDYLVEEGVRPTNPVGRGRYTPGKGLRARRGLVRRLRELPWIPTDEDWRAVLEVTRHEPARNRVMFALAYDAGLRREELCSLRSDDLDPAHRSVRVRAETTKTRTGRVVPYSAATGELLREYLDRRRVLSAERGPLFLSESRRNLGRPITLWTWSKVVRRLALAASVPRFSTHTLRHMCLTDLARSGWELHAIATFAGHRSLSSTLLYIHLSGRDLADKLADHAQVHRQRMTAVANAFAAEKP